uniref:Uncharacterized protein n=1 Tax=Arion vulgaris TaxID=1028688 RepID=A0A0B6ZEL5_9EUPU
MHLSLLVTTHYFIIIGLTVSGDNKFELHRQFGPKTIPMYIVNLQMIHAFDGSLITANTHMSKTVNP